MIPKQLNGADAGKSSKIAKTERSKAIDHLRRFLQFQELIRFETMVLKDPLAKTARVKDHQDQVMIDFIAIHLVRVGDAVALNAQGIEPEDLRSHPPKHVIPVLQQQYQEPLLSATIEMPRTEPEDLQNLRIHQ